MTVGVRDQALVDEASKESFPASDAPSWTPIHAGTPAPVVGVATPRELRERLRTAVTAFTSPEDGVVDYVADAILLSGRSITRIPIKHGAHAENIETVIHGRDGGPEILVGARYAAHGHGVEDPSAVAVLLGLARMLQGRRFARTVRLVAFADDATCRGSRSYARRLRSQRVELGGAILLEHVGHTRGGPLLVISDRGASTTMEAARIALAANLVPARSVTLPRPLDLLWPSDRRAFARRGVPALALTNPWSMVHRRHPIGDLAYDAMADLTLALTALVGQLAT